MQDEDLERMTAAKIEAHKMRLMAAKSAAEAELRRVEDEIRRVSMHESQFNLEVSSGKRTPRPGQ